MDLVLYLLVLIQIGGFITTFSRAGSLGFGASVFFLVFLRSPKKIWKRISLFVLVLMLFTSIIMMSGPRIFTPLLGIRSPMWEGTQKIIKQNFITGTGIGAFSRVYPSFRPSRYFLFADAAPMTLHSHNEILETWAETGVIGLLLMLGFMGSIFYFVLKKGDTANESFDCILSHGLLSGIFGLLVQNIFCMSLRIPFITFYLWLGLGMSTALAAGKSPVFLRLNLQNRLKRLILFILCLGLIFWYSIKFVLFPFLGDFYFQKGYLERVKGNFTRAIDHYTAALSFSPEPRDIYYSRAFILNKIGKEKDALKDYLKIEEISPGYAKVYLNTGITYLSLGYLDDAVDKLKQALYVNPYDSHARNSLGVAYAKKGLPEKAKKEFEQALSLDPGLKEARLNLMKLPR